MIFRAKAFFLQSNHCTAERKTCSKQEFVEASSSVSREFSFLSNDLLLIFLRIIGI